MTQTIVITSGKGGVGKTNISVNAAIELAQRGHRTCLFDADLGLANVNILLGIDPANTLDDYIFGDKDLDEIIIQTKFGIDVIPGSSGIEKIANLERDQISDLVSSFSQIKGYDYFLIDTSSGIARGVIGFCLAGTETIIVITSESTSLTDAYALLKVMSLHNYSGTVKILVNKSPSIPHAKETYLRFKEVVNKHLKIRIAPGGIILNDFNIEKSVSRQQPILALFPDSLASQCIKAVVSNLVKNDAKKDTDDDFSEFWQRYFEFSLLDPAQPEKAVDDMTNKTVSQAIDPEESSCQPSAEPPTESPTVPQPLPAADDNHLVEKEEPTYPTNEPVAPFAHNGGIFEAASLASPTPLLAKALELQGRRELTEETLLTIFSSDPVLMVKALQMICRKETNIFPAKKITSKHQLVQYLGSDALSKLLSTATTQRALAPPALSDTAALTTNFWAHSYTAALLAESIAKITAYPFPEEAFIAGLIHDIGRLALQTEHPKIYAPFVENFGDEATLLETERRIFATTHAEIGAKALRSWHLDSFLVDAVQYHTASLSKIESGFSLVKIVFLACQLSQTHQDDEQKNTMAETLFGLSPVQVQSLLADASDKTQQLANTLGISLMGKTTEEIETRFRRQVMEYAVLQGVLPNPVPVKDLPGAIDTVFQAFEILFHMKPAFCLIPDSNHTVLKTVSSPEYSDGAPLAGIEFSLQWQQSLVIKSFITGELMIAMTEENNDLLPLSDHQLLRSLGSQGFVCVPMVIEQKPKGVIIVGITKTQFQKINSLRNQLEQFGAQAAGNICNFVEN